MYVARTALGRFLCGKSYPLGTIDSTERSDIMNIIKVERKIINIKTKKQLQMTITQSLKNLYFEKKVLLGLLVMSATLNSVLLWSVIQLTNAL